ncbi:hypothetical protein ABW19_dt0205792 [Dactylella cylindrospora]|nr:hypothetical protein ABW19_dt0205792 [Dactylella cylindrospora]
MPPPYIVPKDALEGEGGKGPGAETQKLEHHHVHSHRIFKVYVTGFGPFRDIAVNASYLVASSLPPVLPEKYIAHGAQDTSSLEKLQVSITPHYQPVKVSYTNIESLIPTIYEELPGVDLFVHIGVAPILDYQVETRARRGPYIGKDVDDRCPEDNSADKAAHGKVPVDVKEIHSGLDLKAIREHLVKLKERDTDENFIPPRLSEDAGLYICEYTIYNSMAAAIYDSEYEPEYPEPQPVSDPTTDPPTTSRAVFIHVPNEFNDDIIATARETVMRIIGAIAVQRVAGDV